MRVGAADLRVGPEVDAARIEQQLDAELVVGDAERDDAAERLLGLGDVAELHVRQVDAALHAQLLALRRRQRAAVLAERVRVFLGVVERGRLADHARGADPLHVVAVGVLADRRGRGLGVALGDLVADQDRAVAVVARRRAVEVFLARQRRGLRDHQPRLQVDQREAEPHGRRADRRGRHLRHRAGQQVLRARQVRGLERHELELRIEVADPLRDPPLEQRRGLGLLAGDRVEHRVDRDACASAATDRASPASTSSRVRKTGSLPVCATRLSVASAAAFSKVCGSDDEHAPSSDRHAEQERCGAAWRQAGRATARRECAHLHSRLKKSVSAAVIFSSDAFCRISVQRA